MKDIMNVHYEVIIKHEYQCKAIQHYNVCYIFL